MKFSIKKENITFDNVESSEYKKTGAYPTMNNFEELVPVQKNTYYGEEDDILTYASGEQIASREVGHLHHKTPSTIAPLSLIGTISGIVVEVDPKNNKAIVEFGIKDDSILREMSYNQIFSLSKGNIAPGHGIALYTHKLSEFSHVSTFEYLGDLTTTPNTDELNELEKRFQKIRKKQR